MILNVINKINHYNILETLLRIETYKQVNINKFWISLTC